MRGHRGTKDMDLCGLGSVEVGDQKIAVSAVREGEKEQSDIHIRTMLMHVSFPTG